MRFCPYVCLYDHSRNCIERQRRPLAYAVSTDSTIYWSKFMRKKRTYVNRTTPGDCTIRNGDTRVPSDSCRSGLTQSKTEFQPRDRRVHGKGSRGTAMTASARVSGQQSFWNSGPHRIDPVDLKERYCGRVTDSGLQGCKWRRHYIAHPMSKRKFQWTHRVDM